MIEFWWALRIRSVCGGARCCLLRTRHSSADSDHRLLLRTNGALTTLGCGNPLTRPTTRTLRIRAVPGEWPPIDRSSHSHTGPQAEHLVRQVNPRWDDDEAGANDRTRQQDEDFVTTRLLNQQVRICSERGSVEDGGQEVKKCYAHLSRYICTLGRIRLPLILVARTTTFPRSRMCEYHSTRPGVDADF